MSLLCPCRPRFMRWIGLSSIESVPLCFMRSQKPLAPEKKTIYTCTVPAEISKGLNQSLFGFNWVWTEFKPSLIMTCNILECSVVPPAEMSLIWVTAEFEPQSLMYCRYCIDTQWSSSKLNYLSANGIKVVHNNCETRAFMFSGGSCSGAIFHPSDTKICMVLPYYLFPCRVIIMYYLKRTNPNPKICSLYAV